MDTLPSTALPTLPSAQEAPRLTLGYTSAVVDALYSSSHENNKFFFHHLDPCQLIPPRVVMQSFLSSNKYLIYRRSIQLFMTELIDPFYRTIIPTCHHHITFF